MPLRVNNHGIISVKRSGGLLQRNTATTAGKQLATDLGANGRMAMRQKQVEQRLTLVLSNIALVALGKGQQTLVPDDGELVGQAITAHGLITTSYTGVLVAESQEVEDNGVNGLVGKGVLLLKQRLDEDVGGAAALAALRGLLGGNVAETLDGSGGVKDGNGDSGENGGDDVSLAQSAGAAADEREEEALEEGRGLVEGLFESVEEVDVELLVLENVFADSFENDDF